MGDPTQLSVAGAPTSGRGRKETVLPGILPGHLWPGKRGAGNGTGSRTLAPTPWPESPTHPHPAEPLAHWPGQSHGQLRPGPALEAPNPRVRASLPAFTCRGDRGAPLPALEGHWGARAPGRGRRRGPHRRGSASLCRPPLAAAAGVGGRRGAVGGCRGGGRGTAGRGLHPPLSTATAKACAPPGESARSASTCAPLSASGAETPHTRVFPFILAHPVSESGPPAPEGYRLGGHRPCH